MSAPSSPIVSVLMTAYNREKYIEEAISSVLNSSFRDFELIIVDDSSSDSTLEIAEHFASQDSRIRIFRNERNLGDYPNRNRAAKYATGKYLKYLDSDNVIYPFGLEVMLNCMEQFPEAGYGLSSESDPQRPFPVCASPREAYLDNFFGSFGYFGRAPDSSIIRRSAFESVGGFTGKNLIGDLELWMRLSQRFPVVKMPAYLGWDRVHEDQQKNIDPLGYSSLRDEIRNSYLWSPDCPLSQEEVRSAIRIKKNRQRKQSLKFLAFGRFRLAYRLFALTCSLR